MHLEVSSGRGRYPVIVSPGVLSQLPSLPPLGERGRTAVIISSRPIWRRHGARLRRLTHGRSPLLIPDGDSDCRIEALAIGDRLTLSARTAACTYYCGPGADYAGKAFSQNASASPAVDFGGDPLC